MSSYTGNQSTLLVHGDQPDDDKDESVKQQWIMFGMRLGVTTALHPLEYAKVLIQLGYEPIAPHPGRTFLGRNVLVLPNIFKYVGYIKRTDGLCGCFVGIGPKLAGMIIGSFGSERIAKRLGYGEIVDTRQTETLTDSEFFYVFKRQLSRDVVLHVSSLVLAQPFYVVSVRMMAQFVGQETYYRSFFQSVHEICTNDGILGLFSGLPARIVCDVSCLVLASSTVYIVQKYIMEKRTNGQVTALVNFGWSSLLYPLQVVATCMTVTGSRLAIGRPPHMPSYRDWRHCWAHLTQSGESKRGSSLFFRYYRPVKAAGGMPAMPSIQ